MSILSCWNKLAEKAGNAVDVAGKKVATEFNVAGEKTTEMLQKIDANKASERISNLAQKGGEQFAAKISGAVQTVEETALRPTTAVEAPNNEHRIK